MVSLGSTRRAPKKLRHFGCVLLLCLAAGCGGQGTTGDSPADDAVRTAPSPHGAGPATLNGAIVKGPLRGAKITVHRVDTDQILYYDPANVDTAATSDDRGEFLDLRLTAPVSAPLVLVADTTASTDVSTGVRPVLDQLVALITNEHIAQALPVYATPLTTLAFQLAKLDPQSRRSPQAFQAAYLDAGRRVAHTFPLLDESGIDILNDPPVPTPATTTATAQQRVLRHRLIIEAFADVLTETGARSQAVGLIASTPADILSAVALDVHSDGVLNGYAAKRRIPTVVPDLFARSVATLKLPATTIPLSSLPLYIDRESRWVGAPSLTPYARWNLDVTGPLAVVHPPAVPPDDPLNTSAIQSWTLRWPATGDPVTGYVIYFGAAPDAVFTEVLWSKKRSGTTDFTASFDPVFDFNLRPGDQGCFRIRSYNDAGLSPFSSTVCAVL